MGHRSTQKGKKFSVKMIKVLISQKLNFGFLFIVSQNNQEINTKYILICVE